MRKNKKRAVLTTYEQFSVLNDQIECLYNLILNTHKFYSILSSSIVGVAIILYSNGVFSTVYFDYLYYISILMYAVSILWYRNLSVYLFDLNYKSEAYNHFISEHGIISMYNSSFFINVRKTNIVIPFLLGGIICSLLLKYSDWSSVLICMENNKFCNLSALGDAIWGAGYVFLFYLGFIRKFDSRIFKFF